MNEELESRSYPFAETALPKGMIRPGNRRWDQKALYRMPHPDFPVKHHPIIRRIAMALRPQPLHADDQLYVCNL
jgi:hypothetical protein